MKPKKFNKSALAFSAALLLALPLAAHTPKDSIVTATPRDTAYTNLGEATVTATRLVFVTKKDTIVYDMDALGASQGDMLGDVINKMPGLEIRDGALYFKGRAVNRLLVNGIDFVRGDTQKALENLPAYIIKSVKAYEGKTDASKVTGIDDGTREQVVDVILKRKYMGTWTGNTDLGGGTDDRWMLRGLGNTFTDRFRTTLYAGAANIGAYQNVNRYGNWSDTSAGGSTGDTKYIRPGGSFMWMNSKPSDKAGYFKFEASANWDYRGHNDYNFSEEETWLDDGTSTYGVNDNRTKNDEKILNASLYFTWQPTDRTHVEYGPNYSYTTQEDRTHSRYGEWSVPVVDRYESPLDSLVAAGDAGWPEGGATLLRLGETGYYNKIHSYNHFLWATHKLTDNNWRLSLRNSVNYSYTNGTENNLTSNRYFQSQQAVDPLYNRYTTSDGHDYLVQSFLDLNVPLKFFETLRFTYGYETTGTKNDAAGYRLERLGGIYGDYETYLSHFGELPSDIDWQLVARDADITYNSDVFMRRHWAEVYLQYNKNNIFVSLQNCARFRHDEMDYYKGDFDPLFPRRDVFEYVINSLVRYDNDSTFNCKLNYYFEITPQSLSYEITIPDNSDPLNVSLGNPNMKKQHYHTATFNSNFTFRKTRFLTFDLGWSMYRNSATTRATYDKTSGVTTTQPVNINGRWSTWGQLTYNMSLDKAQLFSLSAWTTYNFSHTPSYTTATLGDPLRQSNDIHTWRLYSQLNGRFKNGYVGLNFGVNYKRSHSSLASYNGLDDWNNTYGVFFQYTLPFNLEFKTTATVTHRTASQDQSFHKVRTVWSAYLTQSFLKDKSLAVKFEVSDILNQRDRSWAYINADNRGSGYAMCVGRFAMLHLIYRFSTKKQ